VDETIFRRVGLYLFRFRISSNLVNVFMRREKPLRYNWLEMEVRFMLLSVVPRSRFEGKDVQKIVRKTMGKRGLFGKKPAKEHVNQNVVWMPYHKILFDYTYSKRGSVTGHGETALNATFCGCVESQRELFVLFRPNYLRHEVVNYSPGPEEVVAPTSYTNFNVLLGGFLKRRYEIGDELAELRSELRKKRMRIRSYSRIIPVAWDLKKEKTLSERVAKLSAVRHTLDMCLNVNAEIDAIKVTGSNVFYFPTLVITLKSRGDEPQRFLIVNIVDTDVKSEHLGYDKALSELCNENGECQKIVARSIMS